MAKATTPTRKSARASSRKTGSRLLGEKEKTGNRKAFVEDTKRKTTEQLAAEHAALLADTNDDLTVNAWKKASPTRMRHKNVRLWDANRVKLKDGGKNGDFVHASFVNGFGARPNAYIIAMAPLDDTASLEAFWSVVWHERVPILTMLCNCSEKDPASGRMVEKCAKYWPEPGKSVKCGLYKVECESAAVDQPVCENQPINVSALWLWRNGTERRRVFHFHYLQWGDLDVPTSHRAVLHLLKLLETRWKEAQDGVRYNMSSPILVHCSAGVGRSGTLVALDLCRRHLDAGAPLNVKEVVRTLRRQRFQSVQNDRQYVFIYQALLIYVNKRFHVPIPAQLPTLPETSAPPPTVRTQISTLL